MNIFSLAPTTEGAYSIPMAIVDFLPVLFYFLASWLIARDLYNKTTKTAFSFLATGSIMVFIGGAFKALWKLLFCFGINYPFFFACFFPMQAPGFCLYLAGLIMTLRGAKKENMNVIATTVTTSMPLLIFQTLGSIGSLVCMCIFAKRLHRTNAIVLFILSIVCLLGMGYLAATLDSSLSWSNWVEQGVNTIGQILFYLGVLILHKNGLADENALKEQYKDLPDDDRGEHWYDSIKMGSSVSKKGKKKALEAACDELYGKYLEAYFAAAKEMPEVADKDAKRAASDAYVQGLLDNGGPSTDIFVDMLGKEKTTEYFKKYIFATE